MKKLLFFVFLASTALADIPKTAEGWYTPQQWNIESFAVSWFKGGVEYGMAYDPETNKFVTDFPNGVSQAEQAAINGLMQTRLDVLMQERQIETLGENLNKVFNTEGITITGQTPDGSVGSYTIRFSSNIGEGTNIEAESDHMKWNLADEKSLHLLSGNKIELWGWLQQGASGWMHAIRGIDIPVRAGPGGDLRYLTWGGIDGLSLGADSLGRMQIAGWQSGTPDMSPSLGDALSSPEDFGVQNYQVLVRSPGETLTLNYMRLGELNVFSGDGKSIVEKGDRTLEIGGYEDASEGNYLKKTADGVEWASIEIPEIPDMPIVPKVVAGDGVIVQYNEQGEDVTQTFSVDTNYLAGAIVPKVDEKSIVIGADKKIALAGYSGTENGCVPVKSAGGLDWYALPTADGVSIIEKADGMLTLKGFDDAPYGAFLRKETDTNVSWTSLGDENSITQNEDGCATIVGASDAQFGEILSSDGAGGVTWRGGITLQVVVDVRLDPNTQKLQKKTANIIFYGEIADEGVWTDL